MKTLPDEIKNNDFYGVTEIDSNQWNIFRGLFRMPSNVLDGTFCKITCWVKPVK